MRRALYSLFLSLSLVACTLGPNRYGVSEQQWEAMTETQRAKVVSGYQEVKRSVSHRKKTIYDGPDIQVALSKGTAMMPPFTEPYRFQPVAFRISPGHCKRLTLRSVYSKDHVKLKACYNGLTLMLDPSRYEVLKSAGSLRLDYNPVWKRGFTYKGISSSGYVRLSKVDITIKMIPDIAPVEDVHHSGD